MFKKKENKKVDCTVKVGFTFYPDSNQVLITYLKNCNSLLAAKYLADRVYNQIDIDVRLNEIEEFPKAAEKKQEPKKETETAEKKEEKTEPKPQTKEEKALEIKKKQFAEFKEKREKAAIKFVVILNREEKNIVVKNTQNCTLPYWVNYVAWRVKDQATTRDIAQTTTMQLIDSIIKDKKKQKIYLPGV